MRLFAALGASACVALPEEEPAPLSAPRILGAQLDPPEVAPGGSLRVTLIAAGPEGALDEGPASFAFCRTPRALTEPGFASALCLDGEGNPIETSSRELRTALPSDACSRFGARTDADLRPRDADPSGGYYQPLLAELTDEHVAPTLIRIRVLCPLADAPAEDIRRYATEYVPNRAPGIDALNVDDQTTAIALSLQLTPDARERYLRFDRSRGELRHADEQLRASWFVTAGHLDRAQTEIDPEGRADNLWHLPADARDLHIWALVRDDRGGLNHITRAVR